MLPVPFTASSKYWQKKRPTVFVVVNVTVSPVAIVGLDQVIVGDVTALAGPAVATRATALTDTAMRTFVTRGDVNMIVPFGGFGGRKHLPSTEE